MRYQEAVRRHLIKYKQQVLGIAGTGVFAYRQRLVDHEHILPIARQDDNLLPSARALWPALVEQHPNLRRHRYFHHLNSSQALALNLFAPFFERSPDEARYLLDALGTPGRFARWEPEWVPDAVENTNFDAAWWLGDGTTVICEVKYTEAGFGKAADSPRHRDKLERTYRGPLRRIVADEALEAKAFFRHYQLLRNIWHLAQHKQRRLVLLMPRGNRRLWQQWEALAPKVAPSVRRRIAPVALEDVIERLEQDQYLTVRLRAHVRAFHEKYLPRYPVAAPSPSVRTQ